MRFTRRALIISTVILSFLFVSTAYAANIHGRMDFESDNIYYDSENALVIEGRWINHTDALVTHINWVDMTVYGWNGEFWEIVAKTRFNYQQYVNLEPNKSLKMRYRIWGAPIKSPSRWNVLGVCEFKYRPAPDEA